MHSEKIFRNSNCCAALVLMHSPFYTHWFALAIRFMMKTLPSLKILAAAAGYAAQLPYPCIFYIFSLSMGE